MLARRRRIYRYVLATGAVLACLVLAGILIVRSTQFHRYLLGEIVSHAQTAVGGRVELGDFAFRWSGLRIDFNRIVLHGDESESSAPLFSADHVTIGLALSLWHGREIRLNDFEIDHPVIHLTADVQGHTNIPTKPGPSSSPPSDPFDLDVRYARINRGEVYYNDEHIPLDAEAHNLNAEVELGSPSTYKSTLSYQSARILAGTLNPLTHDLQAQFDISRSGIAVNSLLIHSPGSSIAGQATLTDYSDPTIAGSYQGSLSGAELGRLLKDPSLPRGLVQAQGTVKYHNRGDAPFIASLESSGSFSSELLHVDFPQARTDVRSLSGEYRLAQGDLVVDSVKAGALGGSLAGRFNLRNLAGTPSATLTAAIHQISLRDARQALRSAPPQASMINGQMDASLEASWIGSMDDLKLRSDVAVTGSLNSVASGSAGSGGTSVPLNGAVHLAYDGRRQVVTLTNSTLHTLHGGLSVSGSIGGRSSLVVSAQSSDLREVDSLVALLQSTPSSAVSGTAGPPQPYGLSGSATFSGTVQGSLNRPQLSGRFTAANLHVENVSFKTLEGGVSISPSGLAIHQGKLQQGAAGSASFDASVGLRDWSYSPQSPIALQVTAQGLQIVDLESMARLRYPVSGLISANITVNGSQAQPSGQGSVQVTRARAWSQPIQDLIVKFQGNGEDLHSTVNLVTSAGAANATLDYNLKSTSYNVQLKAPGVRLDRVEALSGQTPQVNGSVTIAASGKGTLKDPRLQATLDAPQLHVGEQDLSGFRGQVDIANQQAHLTLASTVSGVALQAQGEVDLSGQYQARVTVDTQKIQLGPLLAAFVPQAPNGLAGQTQIHAQLDGPLGAPDQITAEVAIASLSLSYQSLQIANAAPIQFQFRNGTLTLQHTEFKGTGTDLQLQGVLPVNSAGNVELSANGGVDLHLIELLNRQFNTAGRIDLKLSAKGSRAHPDIEGIVRLTDASAVPSGSPVGLEGVNGELDIGGGRVAIKTLSGQSGGGTIEARGFFTYSPSSQFNLGLSTKGVRLLYPDGVRSQTDADLTLAGTPTSAALNGQILFDQLSLTQSFDLSTFADQFSGPSAVTPTSFQQNVKLNVAVLSREEMNVQNSQLSLQGSANLQVRGTLAEPVVLGRTNIVSGELFFQGKRYQVQTGVIQFVNPVQTEPVVNIVATTTVQQFDLTLSFAGPLDRLRTTYTSDPPLSPVDIINLLVTGHTTQASQASSTSPESLLAQGLSSGVSGRVQKLVGISSLTIDPQIGGNQGNAGSQLAIQQRVTKNLFFTFATDVTTTQGEVVQIDYQIRGRYSVSAVRDQTGGYQVQVKVHKVF